MNTYTNTDLWKDRIPKKGFAPEFRAATGENSLEDSLSIHPVSRSRIWVLRDTRTRKEFGQIHRSPLEDEMDEMDETNGISGEAPVIWKVEIHGNQTQKILEVEGSFEMAHSWARYLYKKHWLLLRPLEFHTESSAELPEWEKRTRDSGSSRPYDIQIRVGKRLVGGIRAASPNLLPDPIWEPVLQDEARGGTLTTEEIFVLLAGDRDPEGVQKIRYASLSSLCEKMKTQQIPLMEQLILRCDEIDKIAEIAETKQKNLLQTPKKKPRKPLIRFNRNDDILLESHPIGYLAQQNGIWNAYIGKRYSGRSEMEHFSGGDPKTTKSGLKRIVQNNEQVIRKIVEGTNP